LDFNETQSFVMSEDKAVDYWTFVVYDKWDSTEKYADRMGSQYQLLEDLRRQTTNVGIIPNFVVSNTEECEYWLNLFVEKGYEGAMLRDPASLYKQGRHTLKSQALLKLKSFHDDEAVIIGFEEKMTNTNVKEKDERGYSKRSSKKEGMVGAGTLGALVVRWKDIEFSIGSGFNDDARLWIWNNRDTLLGKPVTFKYQELSKYGVPRFPVFKAVRMDI
jgi:DNA ligase-1